MRTFLLALLGAGAIASLARADDANRNIADGAPTAAAAAVEPAFDPATPDNFTIGGDDDIDGGHDDHRSNARRARIQFVLNATDSTRSAFDLYIDGKRVENDFAFQSATHFMGVRAGHTVTVAVAPGNSHSAADSAAAFHLKLRRDHRYVAIVSGVEGPGFATNPDGRSTALRLFLEDVTKHAAHGERVALVAFNGTPDAPALDIGVHGANPPQVLFDDLAYGSYSGFRTVRAARRVFDVALGNNDSTVIAFLDADLRRFDGETVVLFTSGFMLPSANHDLPGIGLFAVLPNGHVLSMPPVSQQFARLQAIHDVADSSVAKLDVYIDGHLFKNNFKFHTATPFTKVRALVPLRVAFAPANSHSVADSVMSFLVTLQPGKTYVAIASGVRGADYAPNPDGRPIGLKIFARDDGRERASSKDSVDIATFHGVTDGPAVKIWGQMHGLSPQVLIDNLQYGDFTSYRTLAKKNWVIDVRRADNDSVHIASFEAELRSMGGKAAVLFVSGFANPGANHGGPPVRLYAALPSGDVVLLHETVAITKLVSGDEPSAGRTALGVPAAFSVDQNAPNPFNPATKITFALPQESAVQVRIYNARGEIVRTLVDGHLPAGYHTLDFRADGLASGAYFCRVSAGNFSQTKKMLLLK